MRLEGFISSDHRRGRDRNGGADAIQAPAGCALGKGNHAITAIVGAPVFIFLLRGTGARKGLPEHCWRIAERAAPVRRPRPSELNMLSWPEDS